MRTCSKCFYCTLRPISWYIPLHTCYRQLKPFTLNAILDFLKSLNIVLIAILAIGLYFISCSNDYTGAIEREHMDFPPLNLSTAITFLTPVYFPIVLCCRLVMAVVITYRTFSVTISLNCLTCVRLGWTNIEQTKLGVSIVVIPTMHGASFLGLSIGNVNSGKTYVEIQFIS